MNISTARKAWLPLFSELFSDISLALEYMEVRHMNGRESQDHKPIFSRKYHLRLMNGIKSQDHEPILIDLLRFPHVSSASWQINIVKIWIHKPLVTKRRKKWHMK